MINNIVKRSNNTYNIDEKTNTHKIVITYQSKDTIEDNLSDIFDEKVLIKNDQVTESNNGV